MILTEKEADLVRQWYNAVRDMNPEYLEPDDWVLGEKVHAALGATYYPHPDQQRRLPQSLANNPVARFKAQRSRQG